MMTGHDIRERFLNFFKHHHGHTQLSSSGLIPDRDPTLLFTNAGMVPFKGLFLGKEKRDYTRAVSVQKCLRAGGKHNDLENVGRTERHHTFFEMLGNFSFGDYFKQEAIVFAWQFVTKELNISPEKLLITVYSEDHEAYAIWHEVIGLDPDRIIRINTSDNFWSMGDTGPCGPCSEIFYDHGPSVPGAPPGSETGEEGDRFVEIWNLVFMQYNRSETGQLTPLPNPCIDTGAGLERIAAILQGVHSNYDSDLFQPLIQATLALANQAERSPVSLRVIADHVRAAGFLIADGVLPTNEGRGYLLRRIMRRAMRHGRMIGLEEPFLHRLIPTLTTLMGTAYPELKFHQETVCMVIENEEKRFAETLGVGLAILERALERETVRTTRCLDGATAFTLYDTYGFPVDLTADIARDRGVSIDLKAFEICMAEQKRRARAAWSGSGDEKTGAIYHDLLEQGGATRFVGYDAHETLGRVVALIRNGKPVASLNRGETGEIIVDRTVFYGASGGQVGDTGELTGDVVRVTIRDTQKPLPDLIVHHGFVEEGVLNLDETALLTLHEHRRIAIQRHHSATHYLHHALRQTLGEHVRQAGSLVSDDRLRFDFSHFQSVTQAELNRIEEEINAAVLDNVDRRTEIMTSEEAIQSGATALFGEKYGDRVRVVRIGPTLELCGGTHVTRSGDIGLFKILSEGAVAAGVRRIEAVCGPSARKRYLAVESECQRAAALLKTTPDRLYQSIEKLLARQKEWQRELEKNRAAAAGDIVSQLLEKVRRVDQIHLIAEIVQNGDPRTLRELVDQIKNRLQTGVVLLGSVLEKRVHLIAGVTGDLTKTIRAGDLIRFVAPQVGGKGGGRPDMAQGGGSEPAQLNKALASVAGWIEQRSRESNLSVNPSTDPCLPGK